MVAQEAEDRQAVDIGQHPVEHDHVVGRALGQGDRGHAIGRDVDDVPLGDQDPADEAGHLRFVFDYEDAHASSVRSVRRRVEVPTACL